MPATQSTHPKSNANLIGGPKKNESGFRKTVQWYLDNQTWWQNILTGDYQLNRLGIDRE